MEEVVVQQSQQKGSPIFNMEPVKRTSLKWMHVHVGTSDEPDNSNMCFYFDSSELMVTI